MVWAGLGAAAIGAGASIYGAGQANKSAKKLMREQNVWNRAMYDERYRKTMADMKAAGLNPILAYQTGPGGGASGAPPAPVQNTMAGVTPAINSAIAARSANQQIKLQDEQIKLTKNQASKTVAETSATMAQETNTVTDSLLKQAQILLSTSQIGVNSAQAARISQETTVRKLEEFTAAAKAEGAKSEKEIMESALGKYLKWIDVTGRSLNPFKSLTR